MAKYILVVSGKWQTQLQINRQNRQTYRYTDGGRQKGRGMIGRLVGQIDRRTGRQMDRQPMDGWTDRQEKRWTYKQTYEQKWRDGQTMVEGWTDRLIDLKVYSNRDKRMDGQTDEQTNR